MLWLWLLACDVTLFANLPEAPGPDASDSEETATTADTGAER